MIRKTIALAMLLWATPVAAQQAQPTLAPDAQQIANQLSQIGCTAERSTAAQTIVNLQKQVADLQKQLNAKDPPRSGATRK